MVRLIVDRELRAAIVRRSRRRVEAFDLARIVGTYEEALARVIAE
jgi:hypothetical protein